MIYSEGLGVFNLTKRASEIDRYAVLFFRETEGINGNQKFQTRFELASSLRSRHQNFVAVACPPKQARH